MRMRIAIALVAGWTGAIGIRGDAGAVCAGMTLGSNTAYDGSANLTDYANDVKVGASGELIVVGAHRSGPGLDNWLVRRYDAALGTVLSATTYNSPGNSYDYASAAAVDGSGNIVVVGLESRGDLGQSDNWSIRKYNSTLTVLIGSTTYNGPPNSDDVANAVAVDGSGNVFVAGYENRGDLTQGYNWRIIQYNPTLTAILSTTMYSSPPANSTDFPQDMVVDASGNVIVVGYENRNDLGESNNWRITTWSATLTAIVSTTAYHGPGNSADVAYGVALGPTGNIVVAGYEDRADLGEGQNIRVNEYDPALTAILSTTMFNGPANGHDIAWNVAVGAAGHVVVAGYEGAGGAGDNWRMCAWSPGLTTLLTTTDYDGPASTNDYAYGVVVDASGNIVVAGYEAGTVGGDNWRIRRYVCPEMTGGATPPTGPAAEPGKLFAFPNPVTGDTATLAVGLNSDATEVEVTLFNIGMAKVYGETFKDVAASPGHVKLAGLLKVAPGVYLVRVTAKLADGTTTTFPVRKLVVKR